MAYISVHCDNLAGNNSQCVVLSFLLFVALLFIVYVGTLSVCSVPGRHMNMEHWWNVVVVAVVVVIVIVLIL